ncbi:hypothetical protein BVG19_g2280 [[Candida] boidinii]|nr:hypothetical protein BVG19_g2280 [[Candida] boidinii]OWB52084.1 hypothetical protein B5S27_g3656 [[Candida] boidinii]
MESVPPTLKTYLDPESKSIITSQIESDESSLRLLISKNLSIDLYDNKNGNEESNDSQEIDNIIINKLTHNNNEILIKLIDLNLAKLITIKILIINLFNNLNNYKYSNLLILLIHGNNKLNDLILSLINFKKLILNKIENNLSNNCFKNLIIHDLIKFIKADSTTELNNLNSILVKFIFNDNFKSFYFKKTSSDSSSQDNLNLFNNLYDLFNILLRTDLNKINLNDLNSTSNTITTTTTATVPNALTIRNSSSLSSFTELINNLNNIKFKIILNSVTFKNFKKFKNFSESNENDLIKLNEFIESESNETFKRSISISSNYKYDNNDDDNNGNNNDDEPAIQQDEIKTLISTSADNNKELSQLDLDIINSDSFREFYKLKNIKLGINERKIF